MQAQSFRHSAVSQTRLLSSLPALFFLVLYLLCTNASATQTTWIVNNTGDAAGCTAAQCTLRGAMTMAQKGDSIHFNIPGCAVTCLIQPATPLPLMDKGDVTIDGSTQQLDLSKPAPGTATIRFTPI